MIGCMMGSSDTNAYKANLKSFSFPKESSIQYEGIFNEHYYELQQKQNEELVSIQLANSVHEDLSTLQQTPYISCVFTSKLDGQPRNTTPIDINVVLDVSGSMNNVLEHNSNQMKINLAKKTIQTVFDLSLRQNDGFGLSIFNSKGTVVIPIVQKQELQDKQLSDILSNIKAGGSTTLQEGLGVGIDMFDEYISKFDSQEKRYKRILFITDMGDMESSQLNQLISDAAKKSIYVSVIGVGIDFNTQMAESITKNEGSNYFCITKSEQMKQIVVDEFQYSFFPCAFNVLLQVQSDEFELVKTYGTPFEGVKLEPSSDVQQQFPKQMQQLNGKWLTISEINTMTPSPLTNDKYVKGGAILLKLKHQNEQVKSNFEGTVNLALSYTDQTKQNKFNQIYKIKFTNSENIYYQSPTIKQVIYLKDYVELTKNILKNSEQNLELSELYEEMKKFQSKFQQQIMQTNQYGYDLNQMDEVDQQISKLIKKIQDKLEKQEEGNGSQKDIEEWM